MPDEVLPPEGFWEVIAEKTKDNWLEVRDPDGWYRAIVKWDGCVHLHVYHHNAPLDLRSSGQSSEESAYYLHICDLNDMIERLQQLKRVAETHFGEWPR